MSTDDSTESKSFIEHTQSQQQRDDYWDRNEDVRKSIRLCARALQRGERKHYYYIAKELRGTLIPRLVGEEEGSPEDYDDVVGDHREWSFDALTQFFEQPSAYVAAVAPDGTNQIAGRATLTEVGDGFEAGEATARQIIDGAFRSCTAIAEEEEIIRAELRSRVDATMFDTKIGEHIQDAEQDLGDSVEAISLLSGALKNIHTGGTGQGKSSGVESEGEGYYLQNFNEGRDFKLIDFVGLRDGENWFYDIPQHDQTMRRSREEQNLAPSFAEDPGRDPETYPDLEILVPLTPGLTQRELPFDVDDEEFRVRPFTIPASKIRKRLLISIMATKLTPEQESIVRTAYSEVDNRKEDWTLSDLAEEVRSREELSDTKQKPIISTLRQLQQHGFIRTQEDDYTLDWGEIFADTETITVFSQAFIEDQVAQYIAVGHLAETIVKQREQRYGIAEAVLLMREMWKVAPHNRRQSFDATAAALQEAIGHMLTELFRENRHSGVIVGMVQPAIDERGIEYIGPVDFAGPSHHHFNEGVDDNGWKARVNYLTPTEECEECGSTALDRAENLADLTCEDCGHEMVDLSLGRNEELRTPLSEGRRWDDEVPTRLTVDAGYDDDGSPDVDREPVKAFAERCLRFSEGSAVKREKVRVAFNDFLQDHDREPRDFDDSGVLSKFGQRLAKALGDDWEDISRGTKDRDVTYTNLELTRVGEEYYENAMSGLEDAAAPITDE